MQFTNRWYLLAQPNVGLAINVGLAPDAQGNAGDNTTIRKFVLSRMRGTKMTEDRFEVPKNFDAKKCFERSLGVMTGEGDYEVVIELDAWLTDILRGRRWHPSQVWTELPGGASHLRMRLSCLEEIEQWVLSWGTRATVLQPIELRERVGKIFATLMARYAVAA
jgi:predicted DNA-binding transcriptional regulator YafY